MALLGGRLVRFSGLARAQSLRCAALESRGVCLGCLTLHTGPSITESGHMGSKCLSYTVVAFISAGSRFKESLMNISRK